MANTSLLDDTIRPNAWEDFVGQDTMKHRLEIAIDAAISQDRMLDPILLTAPPGTGKTTLASLIASKFGRDFISVTLPMKPDDFFDMIEDFEEGVVFLDEIHAAPKAFQELLQPALEDKVLRAGNYNIDVSGITFIAATITEFRTKILAPLQQRFENKPQWAPYSNPEIAQILSDMAGRLGFTLDADVCTGLAGACGSTPRLAKRFVKAARDLQAVDLEVSIKAILDYVGLDIDGLGEEHMEYLRTIRSQSGRIGLKPLANLMGTSTVEVEDMERILAKQGLVHLTSTGRKISPSGRAKIKESDRVSA